MPSTVDGIFFFSVGHTYSSFLTMSTAEYVKGLRKEPLLGGSSYSGVCHPCLSLSNEDNLLKGSSESVEYSEKNMQLPTQILSDNNKL